MIGFQTGGRKGLRSVLCKVLGIGYNTPASRRAF